MERGGYLVGVAGGSGSGKTSLVRALQQALPAGMACIVSQDDYYHPKEQQSVDSNGKVNFDLPTAIDLIALERDLRRLLDGKPIIREEYTFNQEGKAARLIEMQPAPVILVEGLFVLHHQPVRDLFDLRVYIDTPADVRALRRVQRDIVERGRTVESVVQQYLSTVRPMHERFVEPARATADLVLGWQHEPHEWAAILLATLRGRLSL